MSKNIKTIYLSYDGVELNQKTLAIGEIWVGKKFSLTYYPGRGYSLWIIPKIELENSGDFQIEKFDLFGGGSTTKMVVPCSRSSKAREEEAIRIMMDFVNSSKLIAKVPKVEFEFNSPTEWEGIQETFDKETKVCTIGVQELIGENSYGEVEAYIFKTLENKAKETPLDYLQKLTINGETVWAIDDGAGVTLLLPSEY